MTIIRDTDSRHASSIVADAAHGRLQRTPRTVRDLDAPALPRMALAFMPEMVSKIAPPARAMIAR
ncbi:MAG: hypothetical protein KF800_06320 [Lysobacter sp.]|nr:hypothetical protein [Lysobacter sp.]